MVFQCFMNGNNLLLINNKNINYEKVLLEIKKELLA